MKNKKQFESVTIEVYYDIRIENGYYIIAFDLFGIFAKGTSIKKVIQEFKDACWDKFDECVHIHWHFKGFEENVRNEIRKLKELKDEKDTNR